MKLSDYNMKTLMISLHSTIEEHAEYISDKLNCGLAEDMLVYPPNCGFTKEEIQSLEKVKNDPILQSALRKVLADNSAGVLFEMMNWIDSTSDPNEEFGKWKGLAFVDKTDEIEENDEMLHDALFSTYWDWKEIRPQKDWNLDYFGK